MEGVHIFTRSMLRLLRPLVHHVEIYLSFSFDSDYNDLPCPEVEDICRPLLQLDELYFHEEIMNLKVSLREFYDTIDMIRQQKKINGKNKNVLKNLLSTVYQFLCKQDSFTVKSIKSVIERCNQRFIMFMNAIDNVESEKHLKAFVEAASECLEQVKQRVCDLISRKQQEQLLLCVHQIARCIPLLAEALRPFAVTDQPKPLNSYVSKRICWCFQELEKALGNPEDALQQNRECGGQFVHKMDIALDVLTSEKGAADEALKGVVDEVLCHAMSIAHVAVEEDCNRISQNCQQVLKALEEVRQGFSLEKPLVQGLLRGSLVDALERLEQQVNTALLRLVLEVFNSVFSPLKRLLEIGETPSIPSSRSGKDLNDEVAAFDMQMDRIMQIGLFAIACSQDTNRVVCIRSCLASLESLEPELVPALTAHYLEPMNVSHKMYLQVLLQHWKEEITELQVLLHGIVDPAAFCEVALQDISHLTATIKANLPTINDAQLRTQVSSLLKKAALLQQQVKVSLQEEHGDVLPLHIKQSVEDFYFSCNELDAAFHAFICNKQLTNITAENKKRLLKRCELLVSMVKNMKPLLLDETDSVSKENACTGKHDPVNPKGNSLFFPDSVRDLPVDEDTIVTFEEEHGYVKNNFTELVKRGKALAKERSVLYCTPKKYKVNSVKMTCLQTPRMRTSGIFNYSGSQKSVDHTLGLDVTNILENLTSLSNTLTSDRRKFNNASVTNLLASKFSVTSDFTTGSNCDIVTVRDTFLSSIKSHTPTASTFDMQSLSREVDTLQRIDDLQAVQEKIAGLRATASSH